MVGKRWDRMSVNSWLVVALVLVIVLQALSAKAQASETILDQQSVEYHDLTYTRRLWLGAKFLWDPDSIWIIDIGYKNPITPSNSRDLCQKARQGDGMIGVVSETGTIVVGPESVAVCEEDDIVEGSLVFIDPKNGEPIISWDAHLSGR